jgi:flagellar hook assembly protein FlgD
LVTEKPSENNVSPQQSSFQQLVDENRQFQQKIEELQATMAQLTTSSGRTDEPASAAVSQPMKRRTQGEKDKRFVAKDTCRRCKQRGHWARECPLMQSQQTGTSFDADAAVTKSNSLASSKLKVSVYVNLEYKGAQYHALLDSGCDVSV